MFASSTCISACYFFVQSVPAPSHRVPFTWKYDSFHTHASLSQAIFSFAETAIMAGTLPLNPFFLSIFHHTELDSAFSLCRLTAVAQWLFTGACRWPSPAAVKLGQKWLRQARPAASEATLHPSTPRRRNTTELGALKAFPSNWWFTGCSSVRATHPQGPCRMVPLDILRRFSSCGGK